jgi:hypothetical protein
MNRRERVNRDRGELTKKVLRKLGYLEEGEESLTEGQVIEIASGFIADFLHLAESSNVAIGRSAETIARTITNAAFQAYFDDKR